MAKTKLETVPVADVFYRTVSQVQAMEAKGLNAAVDVGVTFQSTKVSSKGLIGVIIGGKRDQSSISVQLATRVFLDSDQGS